MLWCKTGNYTFITAYFLTEPGVGTYGLRSVHDRHPGHRCELAEDLQREVGGGHGGEALQQLLLEPREAAPLQLTLQLLQLLPVVWLVQRHVAQQLVQQPERHLVLELKVRLHQRHGHPEDGGQQVAGVVDVSRVADVVLGRGRTTGPR